MKKKKFDIRKTFETFMKEPLSILTEGLFQIVNIDSPNIFTSSFNIDFVKGKTQLTIVNNQKMYNLFQSVLTKRNMIKPQTEITPRPLGEGGILMSTRHSK